MLFMRIKRKSPAAKEKGAMDMVIWDVGVRAEVVGPEGDSFAARFSWLEYEGKKHSLEQDVIIPDTINSMRIRIQGLVFRHDTKILDEMSKRILEFMKAYSGEGRSVDASCVQFVQDAHGIPRSTPFNDLHYDIDAVTENNQPQPGDIVYMHPTKNLESGNTSHFGINLFGNVVLSKIGQGPLIASDLEQLQSFYKSPFAFTFRHRG